MEFRFYEVKTYSCPICLSNLRWVKRSDQDDSMVLWHHEEPLRGTGCRLAGRAFYPPVITMPEIQGAIEHGRFVPEWEKAKS